VGSVCHADPQGDWASAMVALDGLVVAQGPRGRRSIKVADFVRGPFQTTLAPDEIAVEAVVPPPVGVVHGGYLKLERRVGDFATAGVAVALETSGDRIVRAGLGLTGVGASTINATDAAGALVGSTLSGETIERAADLAAQAAQAAHRPSGKRRLQAPHRPHVRRADPRSDLRVSSKGGLR